MEQKVAELTQAVERRGAGGGSGRGEPGGLLQAEMKKGKSVLGCV
jgi:hypothetical protein